jgi:hypothetical protein
MLTPPRGLVSDTRPASAPRADRLSAARGAAAERAKPASTVGAAGLSDSEGSRDEERNVIREGTLAGRANECVRAARA